MEGNHIQMTDSTDTAGQGEEDLMACEGVVVDATMDQGTSTGILYRRQTLLVRCRPPDGGGTCPSRR